MFDEELLDLCFLETRLYLAQSISVYCKDADSTIYDSALTTIQCLKKELVKINDYFSEV